MLSSRPFIGSSMSIDLIIVSLKGLPFDQPQDLSKNVCTGLGLGQTCRGQAHACNSEPLQAGRSAAIYNGARLVHRRPAQERLKATICPHYMMWRWTLARSYVSTVYTSVQTLTNTPARGVLRATSCTLQDRCVPADVRYPSRIHLHKPEDLSPVLGGISVLHESSCAQLVNIGQHTTKSKLGDHATKVVGRLDSVEDERKRYLHQVIGLRMQRSNRLYAAVALQLPVRCCSRHLRPRPLTTSTQTSPPSSHTPPTPPH